MKTERVHTLTATFEPHARQAESGVEFWLARDLQHLLGYARRLRMRSVPTAAGRAPAQSPFSLPLGTL